MDVVLLNGCENEALLMVWGPERGAGSVAREVKLCLRLLPTDTRLFSA